MKHFADFYDQLADKKAAKERANKVLKYIRKYNPQAKNILELGTGNGNVLSNFPKKYKLSGLDIEKRFIRLTKEKVPKANLFTSSMHNFKINKKFDVIFSIFDSINFLKNFYQWKETFKTIYQHLGNKGLFIFDVYTPLMLKNTKPITHFSEEQFGFMLTKGTVKGNNLIWNFKIFEKKKNNLYQMHKTLFNEKIFPIKKIEDQITKYFEIIEKLDEETLKKPTKNSERLIYITKKQNKI